MHNPKTTIALSNVSPEAVGVEPAEDGVPAADGERPRPGRGDHAEVGLLDGGVDGRERARQRHAGLLARHGASLTGLVLNRQRIILHHQYLII